MTVTIDITQDDERLANFYHRHWLDMAVPEADVAPDWRRQALGFIKAARRDSAFAGFIAHDAGKPVGSACCHLVARTYPAFRRADSDKTGYVWGVYVVPGSRGRGTGAALVRACLDHLARLGCGRALLHAGDGSRLLYERLGFHPTEELALALPPGFDTGTTSS
jgi:GNAT superfamily N-acetyltransferase